MKRMFYLFITVFIIGSLTFSCTQNRKDEPTNPTNPPFVARVDEKQFISKETSAVAKFVVSTKMLQVIGSNEGGTLYFSLMAFGGKINSANDWKPGVYDFNPIHITNNEYFASGMYTQNINSEYVNWATEWQYVKEGKITIISNDGTKIKGTFYFNTVKQNGNGTYDSSNIKKITDGVFDLEIKNF